MKSLFLASCFQLNWVCDDAYKARIGQSLFYIGSVIGTLMYGLLSDKIGRLPALILSNMCGFIGDFATIFSNQVTTFSLSRFISGLAADTNFYLMYIIGKSQGLRSEFIPYYFIPSLFFLSGGFFTSQFWNIYDLRCAMLV